MEPQRFVTVALAASVATCLAGCGKPETDGSGGEIDSDESVSQREQTGHGTAASDFLTPFEVVTDGDKRTSPMKTPTGGRDLYGVVHTKTSAVVVGDRRILARKSVEVANYTHQWVDISNGAPDEEFRAVGVTNDGRDVWVVSADCSVGSYDFSPGNLDGWSDTDKLAFGKAPEWRDEVDPPASDCTALTVQTASEQAPRVYVGTSDGNIWEWELGDDAWVEASLDVDEIAEINPAADNHGTGRERAYALTTGGTVLRRLADEVCEPGSSCWRARSIADTGAGGFDGHKCANQGEGLRDEDDTLQVGDTSGRVSATEGGWSGWEPLEGKSFEGIGYKGSLTDVSAANDTYLATGENGHLVETVDRGYDGWFHVGWAHSGANETINQVSLGNPDIVVGDNGLIAERRHPDWDARSMGRPDGEASKVDACPASNDGLYCRSPVSVDYSECSTCSPCAGGAGDCEKACPEGGCSMRCAGRGDCRFACPGGDCEITCTGNSGGGGAPTSDKKCVAYCEGGGCDFVVKGTAGHVELYCPGDGCKVDVEGDAQVETFKCASPGCGHDDFSDDSDVCDGSDQFDCERRNPRGECIGTRECEPGEIEKCPGEDPTNRCADYRECIDGQWTDCETNPKQLFDPIPEVCNGLDDDCDGRVDNISTSWEDASIAPDEEAEHGWSCGQTYACYCPPDGADDDHDMRAEGRSVDQQFSGVVDKLQSNSEETQCYCRGG